MKVYILFKHFKKQNLNAVEQPVAEGQRSFLKAHRPAAHQQSVKKGRKPAEAAEKK